MRVLVVGGGGYIGRAFVATALADGWGVTVIDSPAHEGEHRTACPTVWHDASQPLPSLRAGAMGRFDVVVNVASRINKADSLAHPAEFIRENLDIALSLLKYAGDTRTKLVHVSSSEVYGVDRDEALTEQSCTAPVGPYAASKAMQDAAIEAYRKGFGVEATSLVLCNAIGPNRPNGTLLASAAKSIHAGQPVTIYGTKTFSWLAIADAVSAIRFCCELDAGPKIHAAAGVTTNGEVVEAAGEAIGKRAAIVRIGDNKERLVLDSSRLRSLGWAPRLSFADAIKRAVGLTGAVESGRDEPRTLATKGANSKPCES